MTLHEMRDLCEKKLSEDSGVPQEFRAVVLVLPGFVRGNARRLFGKRGGPTGEVVADNDDGQVVAFGAAETLAWLIAKGVT